MRKLLKTKNNILSDIKRRSYGGVVFITYNKEDIPIYYIHIKTGDNFIIYD
ncbi:hypothetical protein HMPREF1867_00545 [Veillonella dispar]|nr:hypothetical protein HMPREF1867_00545 [Veillonella dispar]